MPIFSHSSSSGSKTRPLHLISNNARHHHQQLFHAVPTARFSMLTSVLIIMTLATVPIVSASIAPAIDRADLHGTILLRSSSLPSGEIVGDDLPDSPPHGHIQYDYSPADNVLYEEAVNVPILVAPEHEGSSTHSTLAQRSNTVITTDDAEDADLSIPTAFDTSLNKNFTTKSCPEFFNTFLSNETVTDCHAISMLIRDSTSFFHTLTSAAATSHVLDLACAASVEQCSDIMSQLATNIIKDDACGKDYKLGNPLVVDAYIDMITYEPIYRASCLKNPTTNDYCFVDAATNTTSSADYAVYSIPFGDPITQAPYPTCDECLQASMAIFSTWAQVNGQPLTQSYLPSALAVNRHCGANFADVNITAGKTSSSSSSDAWSTTSPSSVQLLPYILALGTVVSSLVLF